MKFRPTRLSIGSLVLGIALLALSRPPVLAAVFDALLRSNSWEKRANTMALLLAVYSALFLALAVLSALPALELSNLVSRATQGLKQLPNTCGRAAAALVAYPLGLGTAAPWLFLALAIGIAVRAFFLPQPMRGDEAFTFLNYVNGDLVALFNYTAINNHVLNTILIKVCTLLWGASPASIRFPDFVAGIAAIVCVFYLARMLNKDKDAGIFAALATAVFPYLVLFSTNARAYTVIGIFVLVIAILALRYTRNPSGPQVVWLALLSSLGMLTIPVMVLPAAGIFFWVIALLFIAKVPLKEILSRFALPYGVWSAVFTFMLYTPVILASNGLGPIVANKYVKPFAWEEFLALIVPKTEVAVGQLIRDIPSVLLLAALLLFALGLWRCARERNWATLLILPSFLLAAVLIMFAQRQIPYDRTWVFIIPFVLLVADFGLTLLLERLPESIRPLAPAALALAALLFAVNLAARNVIGRYPDTSGFPEAPVAVQYLKPFLAEEDTVRITATGDWSVNFYFWYYGVQRPAAELDDGAGRSFFIVKKSRSTIQDMTTRPVIKLLEIDDMALYERVGK